MNAPQPNENARIFHHFAECLLDIDRSAPRPLAMDAEAGFLLLEDFGDRTFTRALKDGADEAELYRLATHTLIALHQSWGGDDHGLLSNDADPLLVAVELLVDRDLPAFTGREPLADKRSYTLAAHPEHLAAPHSA